MAPFEFKEGRGQLPEFFTQDQEALRKGTKALSVQETPTKGMGNDLKIH